MTQISVVLYYWILVAATLLFTKTAGLADNNEAVIKILIVVTIVYVGVVLITRARGKALDKKRAEEWQKNSTVSLSGKKRKKQK